MSKIGQLMAEAESEDEEFSLEPEQEEQPSAVDNAMVDLDHSMQVLNDNRSELPKYANELRLYAKRLISLAGIANQRPF